VLSLILTRIVIAGLILLGDSAIASETNSRSEAEAVISGKIVQASHLESSDDTDSMWQPLFASASAIKNTTAHKFQLITTANLSKTHSFLYDLYHSRAPPVSL